MRAIAWRLARKRVTVGRVHGRRDGREVFSVWLAERDPYIHEVHTVTRRASAEKEARAIQCVLVDFADEVMRRCCDANERRLGPKRKKGGRR